MRPMMFADEADCVRLATRLPGLFGEMTPGELFERWGVPTDAQHARLLKYLRLDGGKYVPKGRNNGDSGSVDDRLSYVLSLLGNVA